MPAEPCHIHSQRGTPPESNFRSIITLEEKGVVNIEFCLWNVFLKQGRLQKAGVLAITGGDLHDYLNITLTNWGRCSIGRNSLRMADHIPGKPQKLTMKEPERKAAEGRQREKGSRNFPKSVWGIQPVLTRNCGPSLSDKGTREMICTKWLKKEQGRGEVGDEEWFEVYNMQFGVVYFLMLNIRLLIPKMQGSQIGFEEVWI